MSRPHLASRRFPARTSFNGRMATRSWLQPRAAPSAARAQFQTLNVSQGKKPRVYNCQLVVAAPRDSLFTSSGVVLHFSSQRPAFLCTHSHPRYILCRLVISRAGLGWRSAAGHRDNNGPFYRPVCRQVCHLTEMPLALERASVFLTSLFLPSIWVGVYICPCLSLSKAPTRNKNPRHAGVAIPFSRSGSLCKEKRRFCPRRETPFPFRSG